MEYGEHGHIVSVIIFQTFYELLGVLRKRKMQDHCTEAVNREGFLGFLDLNASEMFREN